MASLLQKLGNYSSILITLRKNESKMKPVIFTGYAEGNTYFITSIRKGK